MLAETRDGRSVRAPVRKAILASADVTGNHPRRLRGLLAGVKISPAQRAGTRTERRRNARGAETHGLREGRSEGEREGRKRWWKSIDVIRPAQVGVATAWRDKEGVDF